MSSIPERLWRVVRGHWEFLEERADEAVRAQEAADAYAELAAHLRAARAKADQAAAAAAAPGTSPAPPGAARGGRDPFAVSYELLGVKPGVDLDALEAAYQARLAELPLEKYAEGTPQRQAVQSRRDAVEAAYEKLRDVLNPTETRFEKIEF
jgi:hypothetical protein